MKISVVIPTFNRKEMLYPVVLCLLNQDTQIEYEIVIIDSGTDDTQSVILQLQSQFGEKIVYKKIKHCHNRSLLRNKGAVLSKSEIIVFLDNDMLVDSDFIQKHYDAHQKVDEKTIVLGKRHQVLEFNAGEFGYGNLLKNFDLIKRLPNVADVRDYLIKYKGYTIETINNPWQFMYSHNVSMKRSVFEKSGGFNVKFGEEWGYEDLEYGLRLYRQGFKFTMDDTNYGYHQPHFERKLPSFEFGEANRLLFVKENPCYETELFGSFPDKIDEFYKILSGIPQDNSETAIKNYTDNYDLVFCTLYSIADIERVNRKCWLGLVPVHDLRKKQRKLLIRKELFLLPKPLQTAVLSEATIITDVFDVEIADCTELEKKQAVLYTLMDCAGYSVEIQRLEKVFRTTVKKQIVPKLAAFHLPDAFLYEKRFVSSFIAERLIENDWALDIQDQRNNFAGLPDICKPFEDCSLGGGARMSVSFLDAHNTGYFTANNSNAVILFNDIEYPYIDEAANYKDLDYCKILSKEDYELCAFSAVVQQIKADKTVPRVFDFCCFMNNGFYEDGIDIILKAFHLYATKKESQADYTQKKLVVLVPDYNETAQNCYPKHNEASRNVKLFGIKQKIEGDYFKLLEMIKQLGLQDRIEIKRAPFNIHMCFNLLSQSKRFLCISKTLCPQVSVSVAVLAGCNVITTEKAVLNETLQAECDLIPFTEACFIDGFDLPCDSDLVKRTCVICEPEVIAEKLSDTEFRYADIDETDIERMKHDFMRLLRDF